jgi:hypothetical protein
MEYVIEITKPNATEYVSMSKGVIYTTRDIKFASKFKVRARAEKFTPANGQVQPFFGGVVTSNKATVTGPQTDRIRRN